MVVNFEFLDEEPIENVITCLNFKVDKVIFFGFSETMKNRQKSMEFFLKKYCGVKEVEFYALSAVDLEHNVGFMKEKILEESQKKNECFFDLTGGEGLALLAFGILSREHKVPMHLYDVEKNQLIEFDKDYEYRISKNVPKQKISLDLDQFIEMQGGVINDSLHKGFKACYSKEDLEDIKRLWRLYKLFPEEWNEFSMLLKRYKSDLEVTVSVRDIMEDLKAYRKIGSIKMWNRILDAFKKEGIFSHVVYDKKGYAFTYKNQFIKECLWDAGAILELHTFLLEKEKTGCTDCRIGVHLDWDGTIHQRMGMDVLNEIDVLSFSGNIPTFISCKGGNTDQNALYELETVAERFGGKYAKKVLVLSHELKNVHKMRAEEMGIEVRVF